MSADIHAKLLDEAAQRRCNADGFSSVGLDDKSSASGQALEAAAATIGRAIWKAMPRSLMFQGRRYRLNVESLIGRIDIKAITGEPVVAAIVEVRQE